MNKNFVWTIVDEGVIQEIGVVAGLHESVAVLKQKVRAYLDQHGSDYGKELGTDDGYANLYQIGADGERVDHESYSFDGEETLEEGMRRFLQMEVEDSECQTLFTGMVNLFGERLIKLSIQANSKEEAQGALKERAELISKREAKELVGFWVTDFEPDIVI